MQAILGFQVWAPRSPGDWEGLRGLQRSWSLEMAFVAVPSLASRLLTSLTDFAQSDGSINDLGNLLLLSAGVVGRARLALCQAWEAPLRAVPTSISLGHRRVAGPAGAAGAAGVAGLAEPAGAVAHRNPNLSQVRSRCMRKSARARIPLISTLLCPVGQRPQWPSGSQDGETARGKWAASPFPINSLLPSSPFPALLFPNNATSLASGACPTLFPHCLTEAQIPSTTALRIRHTNASITSVRPANRVKEL